MRDFNTKIDNDSTSAGVVVADEYNSMFNEAKGAITPFMGLNEADNKQLAKSIDIASKAMFYTDTGTPNAVILERGATTETLETLFDGMVVMFAPANANTGATTLKIKTLDAKDLKYNGAVLDAGYLKTGLKYIAVYNVANNRFDCDTLTFGLSADEMLYKDIALTASNDLDAVIKGGLYYNPSAGNTTGNNYPFSIAGTLLVQQALGVGTTQMYSSIISSGARARVWFRAMQSNVWGDWIEIAGVDYVDSLVSANLTTNAFMQIQDRTANGVRGQNSVAGLNTKNLNTVLENSIAGASLSSNEVTLPAGKYYVEANGGAFDANFHRMYLENITDSLVSLLGTVEYTSATYASITRTMLSGTITIPTAKVFKLVHWVQSGATNGFGGAESADGNAELHTDVKIWKVG